MIQLCTRPDYYRMVLKIRYGGDSEILNYEYERDSCCTSEDDSHQIVLMKTNKRQRIR